MFLIGSTNGENQDIHYIFTCAREKETGKKAGKREGGRGRLGKGGGKRGKEGLLKDK